MNTHFTRLVLIALGAQITACATVSDSIREWREAHRASMSQSVLGAVPCVTRASEIAFGVPVETSTAYTTTRATNSIRYLGPAAELVLYPAGKPAAGAQPSERVRFAFWPRKADTTEVHYHVDAPAERRQILEQMAVGALEQCAATVQ